MGAGWLLLGCGGGGPDAAPTSRSSEPTIYGADDRLEVFEARTLELAELARGRTVALMPRSHVTEEEGVIGIDAPSLGDAAMLCPGERFFEQPAAAACTGMLVEDDLVLTAGHCLDALPCYDLAVVRGYYYDAPGELHAITSADVATCGEVIAKRVDLPQSATQLDYAWFRIDPPLSTADTAPLVLAEAPMAKGSLITSANHGAGLPLKIQENGRVADTREQTGDHFVANLDAFHGASGAPVFDRDHRVVGLLARGGTDFFVTEDDCFAAFVDLDIDESAQEQATYAFRAVSGLCERSGASRRSLCPASPAPSSGDGGGCAVTTTKGHVSWPLPLGVLLGWAAVRRRRRYFSSAARSCRRS